MWERRRQERRCLQSYPRRTLINAPEAATERLEGGVSGVHTCVLCVCLAPPAGYLSQHTLLPPSLRGSLRPAPARAGPGRRVSTAVGRCTEVAAPALKVLAWRPRVCTRRGQTTVQHAGPTLPAGSTRTASPTATQPHSPQSLTRTHPGPLRCVLTHAPCYPATMSTTRTPRRPTCCLRLQSCMLLAERPKLGCPPPPFLSGQRRGRRV